MSRYVVDLSSRAALKPAVAGGKGAGLAWLRRHNVNVPAGFVITTDAFRDFLAANTGMPGDEGSGWKTDHPSALRHMVETGPLPRPIAEAVTGAYSRLGGPVAVRSSLVGEDAGSTSFAGQFVTELQVDGEEALLRAIRACWASLYAGRAAGYLAHQQAGIAGGTDGLLMAVVVQRMVAATSAGVAFSADPISGETCVIIEAARGLGDGLALGKVAADRYVVDARGVLVQTAPATVHAPVIGEADVMRLAGIVRDLDVRAGGPQDVEWAFDGVEFHILQCRPITSLAGRHVYSNRVVADMAPGLVKPMVYSTNTLAMAREVFGKLFTELIGPNDYDFTRLVLPICSRVYADVTLMGELLTRVGLPPNFMEMMMRAEHAERGRKMRMDPRALLSVSRMVRLAVRHGRLPRQQAEMLAARQAALAPYRDRDWSPIPLRDLLAQLDALVASRNSTLWLFFVSVMGMAVRNAVLRRWVERRVPEIPYGDLIRGLTGLRSLEPMHEIGKLAELARQLPPALGEDLAAADPDTLRVRLGRAPEGRTLLAAVDAFLGRFGFLGSNGSDFTASTWAESPVLIWRAIARSAARPDAASPQAAAAARAEACRRVRASLGPVRRRVFDRLLASLVAAIDLREGVSLLVSEYSYQMRRLFLAAAQQLVAQGALAEREDLFYLTYGEMVALAGGGLSNGEARQRIAARRAEIAADALISPPSVISGDPSQVYRIALPEAEAGAYLSGIAGSAGTAHGRARVVNDPLDAPAALNREDILIVPYSDVGWTPLFSSIGGIVAETGGQLSHAAIVAREYDLPAVVGVKDATRLIREGQLLSIDGDRGRVHLRSEQAESGGEAWTPLLPVQRSSSAI